MPPEKSKSKKRKRRQRMKGLELKNKLQLGHLKTVKDLQREKKGFI